MLVSITRVFSTLWQTHASKSGCELIPKYTNLFRHWLSSHQGVSWHSKSVLANHLTSCAPYMYMYIPHNRNLLIHSIAITSCWGPSASHVLLDLLPPPGINQLTYCAWMCYIMYHVCIPWPSISSVAGFGMGTLYYIMSHALPVMDTQCTTYKCMNPITLMLQ